MVSTLDAGPQTGLANADPREGRSPRWSRDGSEIFYRSGNTLMRVPVQPQSTFAAGAPEALFTGVWIPSGRGQQYDVSPDGRRFLMIRARSTLGLGTGAEELVVVQNWFEDVRERLREGR